MTIEAHHDTGWKIPYSKADKTRFIVSIRLTQPYQAIL